MNNNKKLYLLIASLMLGGSVANANHCAHTGNYFSSGAYVGAAGGYSYMNASINDQVFVTNLLPQTNGSGRATGTSNKLVGDLLLGYREFVKNGFMLGVEFDLGKDNNRISKNMKVSPHLLNNTVMKSNYKFVPSVIIGQQVNDRWLGFAKLGMSLRRFEVKHNVIEDETGITQSNQSFRKTKKGFMAAVGAEYAFNKNISSTIDVTYERFQKVKLNYDPYIKTRQGVYITGTNNNGSVRPSYVTVKVGVLYRF